jgi:hypothetical protein
MKEATAKQVRTARHALGGLTSELAALELMTVGELAEQFEALFGFPTRTRNKAYLRKRVAWKIQERHEGGLSDRALARIEELAPLAPARWRRPSEKRATDDAAQAPSGTTRASASSTTPSRPRDPRLPPAGAVLRREHGGETHDVTVGETDFDYRGSRYASLSQVAKAITGTAWNGFIFFGLAKRGRAAEGGER